LVQELNSCKSKKAALVLEDGTVFLGKGFGAARKLAGEVVFSTSMVGYPEALTDPSYRGQILSLTYPLVGNYGVPPYDLNLGLPLYFESDRIQTQGLIIHELCEEPYHWASTRTLDKWLADENIPGISGVDTRRLTKKLRTHGVMLGIIQVCEEGQELDLDSLLKESQSIPDPNATDLVKEVSVKDPIQYKVDGKYTVALIDCGVKNSIIRNLLRRGINVVRVPYDTPAYEILGYKPDGIFLSNGPGDPKKCVKTVQAAKELVEKLPVMGICLGAQILALSQGGDTYKLKFGHRGANQPVRFKDGRIFITTQNHGFAVDADSLPEGCSVSYTNVNDGTLEGFENRDLDLTTVQFHPEAHGGPMDTEAHFFDDLFRRIS